MQVTIQENVSLRALTSFKVGGPARFLAQPTSVTEVQEALAWARVRGLESFILGKGSNLVVSDHGYPGLVMNLSKNFSALSLNGSAMACQAGCLLHTAVVAAVDAGLAGIENLGGIPGTLGGGAFINAGAFEQELCQVITQVTTVDSQGTLRSYANADCGFSYRHSSFFSKPLETIVEVQLSLRPGDPSALRQQMNAILQRRREKQPIELPNAGSMFKRPPGKFAGTLIEQSGLKGARVGDAQVSEKHANFIVNLGAATAQQIWDLTEMVIAKVHADHGITLEREVIFLGEFT